MCCICDNHFVLVRRMRADVLDRFARLSHCMGKQFFALSKVLSTFWARYCRLQWASSCGTYSMNSEFRVDRVLAWRRTANGRRL